MNVGVVGGGILGLCLAHRLSAMGHAVTLFEASPHLGGLAGAHDYGSFTWDRFYHCILPTDVDLIRLLGELGLGDELRWKATGTGYYHGGNTYSMSGTIDFIRFPLLSLPSKARLAASVVYATRFADPWKLYDVSAKEWLTRWCGRRGYELFWRPLLRAKFGPYHDRVAAVFIWATLTRLFGARAGGAARETLGYCRGGYHRIFGVLRRELERRGVDLRTGTAVVGIDREPGGCAIRYRDSGEIASASFDQVVFTAPTRVARKLVDTSLLPVVERTERDHPTSGAYLGVACLVVALRRPLTPYYALNIGDERVELTGLIEMTNLIDAGEETGGLSLVYLPRYLDSEDPRLRLSDDDLADAMMERGVRRLFPDLTDADVVYRGLHRATYVQPLPLVGHGAARRQEAPALVSPFQILNTSMLTCATLNNNEVVRLVDAFVERNLAVLGGD
ncbi:MAG: FAD-dependent oxidoreductase [Thermoanaerobaculia bacterium]